MDGGTATEKKRGRLAPCMTGDLPSGDRSPAVVRLTQAGFGHGGKQVIEKASCQVPAGSRVLVVGANGSGKSTLLATLSGLLPLMRGQIEVLGLDPLQARRRLHEDTGHLGHTDPFYPELTGRENLALHARLRRLGDDDVNAGLQRVALAAEADRLVAHYSHGMRRRLGLAKALLGSPRLLLLDEPDSGLDRDARARLAKQLESDHGMSVLMASHHAHDHLSWADRVWVLGGGRLIELDAHEAPVTTKRLDAAMREADA